MTIATQCPPDEMLRRYAIGDYTDGEGDRLEAHFTICQACEETLARFDDADDSLVRHMPLVTNAAGVSEYPSWLWRLTDGVAPPNRGSERENTADAESDASAEERDFGAYELTGILGRGGMGVVYAATHRKLGKPIAIKVVSPKLIAAEDANRRFDRETRVLGTLNHPGIVSATDAGTIGGAAYLAMERVDGVNLAKLVQHVGPLRVDEACEIGRQIALALAAAHESGAVHRDIKPSNVMIDREGKVKLLDFGLAYLSTALTTQTETSLGKLLGTLEYMAPEQAAGGDVGPAADVYGLGATVFFLLTGRPPRDKRPNESLIGQLRRTAETPATRLSDCRSDIPAELEDLIAGLLACKVLDRPESAQRVAQQFASFCEPQTEERLERIADKIPLCQIDQSQAEVDQSLAMLLGSDSPYVMNDARSLDRTDPSPRPLPVNGNFGIGRKLLVALGGIGFIAALLGVILVLQTPEGTVRIESELSGVTLDFVDKKDRVTGIEVDKGKNSADLRTGRYIVKFREPQVGFVISPNGLQIDEDRDITVRVHRLGKSESELAIDAASAASLAQHTSDVSTAAASDQSASDEDVAMEIDKADSRVKVFVDAEGQARLSADGKTLSSEELIKALASREPTFSGIQFIADPATTMKSLLSVRRAIDSYPKLNGIVIGMEAMRTDVEFQAPRESGKRSGPTETPKLYEGKTESQWKTIFEAEQNPIAKIEAGKALVMLTDSLSPAQRVDRILAIAGDLIEDGFGPRPNQYLGDYLGGRVARATVMRWPKGFEKLSDTWFGFDQLCESRISSISSSIICDRLLRIINDESTKPKVAMAVSMLFDYAIRKKVRELEIVDRILSNRWDIENPNDIGRLGQLRAEQDELTSHLASVLGKVGRRRDATDADKIRQSVTKAIKRTLAVLDAEHKPLAEHLSASLSLGYAPMYSPAVEVDWQT